MTSNEELKALIVQLDGKFETLSQRVGHESDDGKSGTGLFGEVRRMKGEVEQITGLKHKGLGLVAALIVILAVAVLGFKGALAALLGASK